MWTAGNAELKSTITNLAVAQIEVYNKASKRCLVQTSFKAHYEHQIQLCTNHITAKSNMKKVKNGKASQSSIMHNLSHSFRHMCNSSTQMHEMPLVKGHYCH